MGILPFKFKLKVYLVLIGFGSLSWLAIVITLGFDVATIFAGVVVGGSIYGYAEFFVGEDERSGREKYDAGFLERQQAKWLDSDDPSQVSIDDLSKKSSNADPTPELDLETSLLALGQTGRGKSTFAKSVINRWNHQRQGIILHALSDGAGPNEFEQFVGAVSSPESDVVRLSTADPDVRWDVFQDYDTRMTEMVNIAEGMWDSESSKPTGYDESAKALLTCALAITSAKYDDFAYLDDVLTRLEVDEIVETTRNLPNSAAVVGSLDSMSHSELSSAYSVLMGRMRNLLMSDLFDESLPSFSLLEYYSNPVDYVVIDNIRTDTYARPFWRFFLSTAIDLAMENPEKQYFVLDELDKLPQIDGLSELASAGRTANAQGVLIAQDIHQIKTVYGEEIFQTIWGNSPNRAVFAPGDSQTAEYVLESLGKDEMTQQSISGSQADPNLSRSRSREDRYPITPRQLMGMSVGECLIQSRYGWWIAQIREPTFPELSPSESKDQSDDGNAVENLEQ